MNETTLVRKNYEKTPGQLRKNNSNQIQVAQCVLLSFFSLVDFLLGAKVIKKIRASLQVFFFLHV